MKTQARVTFVESFAVPPETLFDVMLDHEGMSDWMGAKISVVRGPDDGGVGTVRRIEAGPGPAIDEEVTYVLRPRRIVYRIVAGAPPIRFHRGEILVEPWGETGSQLTWDILLDSAIPGVARLVGAILEPQIQKGLSKLRAQLGAVDHSSSSTAPSAA
ncbi:MAG: SRPBCC family protein [Sandaracinaceae bacterium]|nr:SRPBCC family protein [Sandaracinaceae bacterium]